MAHDAGSAAAAAAADLAAEPSLSNENTWVVPRCVLAASQLPQAEKIKLTNRAGVTPRESL